MVLWRTREKCAVQSRIKKESEGPWTRAASQNVPSVHTQRKYRAVDMALGRRLERERSFTCPLSQRQGISRGGRKFVAVQMRNGSGRRLVWITILGIN